MFNLKCDSIVVVINSTQVANKCSRAIDHTPGQSAEPLLHADSLYPTLRYRGIKIIQYRLGGCGCLTLPIRF